jgi:hypothetical protein
MEFQYMHYIKSNNYWPSNTFRYCKHISDEDFELFISIRVVIYKIFWIRWFALSTLWLAVSGIAVYYFQIIAYALQLLINYSINVLSFVIRLEYYWSTKNTKFVFVKIVRESTAPPPIAPTITPLVLVDLNKTIISDCTPMNFTVLLKKKKMILLQLTKTSNLWKVYSFFQFFIYLI